MRACLLWPLRLFAGTMRGVTYLTLALVVLYLILGLFTDWLARDRCLDRGSCWNVRRHQCIPAGEDQSACTE